MIMQDVAKLVIGKMYSVTAERFYEPLIVRGTLPLFGGRIHERIADHGVRAAAVAGDRPILDMPVGTAYFSVDTARSHQGLVVGADLADGMVHRASRRASEAGTDNLALVRADAHNLPFAEGSFGAVICANGLQVIPDLQRTVDELARVLDSPGALFATIPGFPVGAMLPEAAAARLPVFLRGLHGIGVALQRAGLQITAIEQQRLIGLIEAVKLSRLSR